MQYNDRCRKCRHQLSAVILTCGQFDRVCVFVCCFPNILWICCKNSICTNFSSLFLAVLEIPFFCNTNFAAYESRILGSRMKFKSIDSTTTNSLERIKMGRKRARLKRHETYNFCAVCVCLMVFVCAHSRISFVWLLPRKMQINSQIWQKTHQIQNVKRISNGILIIIVCLVRSWRKRTDLEYVFTCAFWMNQFKPVHHRNGWGICFTLSFFSFSSFYRFKIILNSF